MFRFFGLTLANSLTSQREVYDPSSPFTPMATLEHTTPSSPLEVMLDLELRISELKEERGRRCTEHRDDIDLIDNTITRARVQRERVIKEHEAFMSDTNVILDAYSSALGLLSPAVKAPVAQITEELDAALEKAAEEVRDQLIQIGEDGPMSMQVDPVDVMKLCGGPLSVASVPGEVLKLKSDE
jgi:hypothetical protein